MSSTFRDLGPYQPSGMGREAGPQAHDVNRRRARTSEGQSMLGSDARLRPAHRTSLTVPCSLPGPGHSSPLSESRPSPLCRSGQHKAMGSNCLTSRHPACHNRAPGTCISGTMRCGRAGAGRPVVWEAALSCCWSLAGWIEGSSGQSPH